MLARIKINLEGRYVAVYESRFSTREDAVDSIRLAIASAIGASLILAPNNALAFCIGLIDFMSFNHGYGFTDKTPNGDCLMLSVMVDEGIWLSVRENGTPIIGLTKVTDTDLKAVANRL
jgi:hypothetical protein